MQEFDKELQIRLDKDKGIITEIDETLRQLLHQEVFDKINKKMGWSQYRDR